MSAVNKRRSVAKPKRPEYFGEDLIFIISQPKAGSTLLQRILAGHPDVQTSAETWLMLHPVYGMRNKGIETDYRAKWAATGVREFLENYADGENTYKDGIRAFAATVYGRVLEKHGKKLFLDKTPRYTMIVPELKDLFPEAKFILLIRNPLAILSSELRTYVRNDWNVLSNFEPDLIDAPRRIIAARGILGEQAIKVRYESLVSDPEIVISDVCDFLGIEFQSGILDYSETPAPIGRMNDPVGIHRYTSPSKDNLEKWKQLGRNEQHRHFALSYLDVLGDQTISALGYDPGELRLVIEEAVIESSVRSVFPWSLAILRSGQWSLRQQIAAAYHLATQKKGRIAGVFASAKVFLSRFTSAARRLASPSEISRAGNMSAGCEADTSRNRSD